MYLLQRIKASTSLNICCFLGIYQIFWLKLPLMELNLAKPGCVPLHIPVNCFTERAMYFLSPEQLSLAGNHTHTIQHPTRAWVLFIPSELHCLAKSNKDGLHPSSPQPSPFTVKEVSKRATQHPLLKSKEPHFRRNFVPFPGLLSIQEFL